MRNTELIQESSHAGNRILHLITKTEFGGAQSHVWELLRGLSEYYDMSLAAGQEGYLMSLSKERGVETYSLSHLTRNISPTNEFRAYREIQKILKEKQPHLLHCHSSKAGILGRIAATHSGIKSVFTAHGWAFAQGVPLHRKIIGIMTERFAARLTEKVITVSEADAALARCYRISSGEKLVTIHNGVPDSPWRARPSSNDPVQIIMVARFSEQKDQATLLHALTQLKGEFSLVLVGTGPLVQQTRTLINNLHLSTKVKLLGDRKDIPELLAASHICVLSTNWEGLPISIIEAMRAGLPVVATDVGGTNELVEHEVNGFLTPPQDATNLAKHIQRLIDSPNLRADQGNAGRARFELEFTSDKMIDRTKQLYESILKN